MPLGAAEPHRGVSARGAALAAQLRWPCRGLRGPVAAGIDHRWAYDDGGIWRRSIQRILMDSLIGGEVLCGLWEGRQSRFGHTCWRAIVRR